MMLLASQLSVPAVLLAPSGGLSELSLPWFSHREHSSPERINQKRRVNNIKPPCCVLEITECLPAIPGILKSAAWISVYCSPPVVLKSPEEILTQG